MGSLDRSALGSVGANSLAVAGRDIRIAAKRRFEDPSATVAAVEELIARPEILEEWATHCLNTDEERSMFDPPEVFRFADLPPAYRKASMESLAVAYLAAGKPVPEQSREEEVYVEFG